MKARDAACRRAPPRAKRPEGRSRRPTARVLTSLHSIRAKNSMPAVHCASSQCTAGRGFRFPASPRFHSTRRASRSSPSRGKGVDAQERTDFPTYVGFATTLSVAVAVERSAVRAATVEKIPIVVEEVVSLGRHNFSLLRPCAIVNTVPR
jgi:hypothetical protein